ncbi:hypothetical protein HY546_03635 [archaeon]|nr:hypothetical protein [archaeon]
MKRIPWFAPALLVAAGALYLVVDLLIPNLEQDYTWVISARIIDAVSGEPVLADVYADNIPVAKGVSLFRYEATRREIRVRVEAAGYEPWDNTFIFKQGLQNSVVEGPVRLKSLLDQ